MATYQRPGVFIQETLTPITQPSVGTSDSIAAFVGTSSHGGPVGPTLINSWAQYQSLYGNIKQTQDDLAYAVWSFFVNGGSQCYICLAKPSTPGTAAKLTVMDTGTGTNEASTPKNVLTITANAAGTWANNYVFVTITSETDNAFDLSVDVGDANGTVAHEEWQDITLDPTSDRYALTMINSLTIGSQYVTAALATGVTGTFGADYSNPAAHTSTALTGGTAGSGSTDYVTATELLGTVDDNLMVNVPAVSDSTTLTSIITWAEAQGNIFVVVDPAKPGATDTASTVSTALQTLASGLPATSYAAVYGPWIYVQDTGSSASGAIRLTAPGGMVLGQFARNDVTRGVQKAPAGVETSLNKVVQVFCKFASTDLDTLNSKNINVIRSVPGNGFCIMGARTLQVGFPDRYVNIRRTLMVLKKDMVDLCQFAIFEENDSDLWDQITAILEQYLLTQWQLGVLQGSVNTDAYYVICDSTNNDPADAGAGVVNVEVGVALASPAEFIIINIGQFDGTTTVSDTTSNS